MIMGNENGKGMATLDTQIYLNIRIWSYSMIFYYSGKGKEWERAVEKKKKEKCKFGQLPLLKYSKSALFDAFQWFMYGNGNEKRKGMKLGMGKKSEKDGKRIGKATLHKCSKSTIFEFFDPFQWFS